VIERTQSWKNKAPALLLLCMLISTLTNSAFAQLKLDGFSPAFVEIGTTTSVKLSGTFPKWPVKVVVEPEGLDIEVGDKTELKISVADHAVPGVYWLRMLDENGASAPRAIIVDRMGGVVEVEPNDQLSKPQEVKLPVAVSGVLSKSGDVDCYAVNLKQGDTLIAAMIANPVLGTSIDGLIQVSDSRGFVLDQNDDTKGIDPQLAVTIPRDGKYLIRTFAFPAAPNSTVRFAGGADYRYVLRMTTGPMVDASTSFPTRVSRGDEELTGWNLPPSIKPISNSRMIGNSALTTMYSTQAAGWFETKLQPVHQTVASSILDVTGNISQPREFDLYSFESTKGRKLRLELESRQYGFELDPVVTVFNSQGKKLAEKDDRSKTEPDPILDFVTPANGNYFVRVKDAGDAGGSRYHYRLHVTEIVPDFELTTSNSNWVVAKGKDLEVEITVNRKDGFAQDIEISVDHLPTHIKCEPVVSKPKGESAKKVKLKLTASNAKFFQGKIQIVGATKGSDSSSEMKRFASYALPTGNSTALILTVKE